MQLKTPFPNDSSWQQITQPSSEDLGGDEPERETGVEGLNWWPYGPGFSRRSPEDYPIPIIQQALPMEGPLGRNAGPATPISNFNPTTEEPPEAPPMDKGGTFAPQATGSP